MPLFEFECRHCGCKFEEIFSLAELMDEPPRCPDCRSDDVARAFSTFATGAAGGAADSGGGCGGGGGFT